MSPVRETTDGLGDIALSDGPWNVADAPDGFDFVDFGPLQLPLIPGMKVRVERDRRTGKLGAVSVKVNDAEVQLQVIAAPSGQPYWSDIRSKLLRTLRNRPGSQLAHEGRFGAEIIATVTGRRSDGMLADTTMRIVGVEGDRWVLRAVVTGAGVTADATVDRVDAFVSQCAVQRGSSAIGAGTVMVLKPAPGQWAESESRDDAEHDLDVEAPTE
jgi:hypothetical protein